MQPTNEALSEFGLGLDHRVKQTSYYLGNADPTDIATNQEYGQD